MFVFWVAMIAAATVAFIVGSHVTARKSNHADSDPAFYPPAQRIGAGPWVMIGMVVGVPLILVLMISWNDTEPSAAEPSVSRNSQQEHPVTAVESDAAPSHADKEKTEGIPVPAAPPRPHVAKTTIKNPLPEDLNADLEGSGASLLMESVFRSVLDSFNEKWVTPKAPITLRPEEIPEVAKLTPKPRGAIKLFFSELLPTLPKGISEKEASEALSKIIAKFVEEQRKGPELTKEFKPAQRPDWMKQPDGFDRDTGVYRTVVTVGPYETQAECGRHCDEAVREAVEHYIKIHPSLGSEAQGRITLSDDQLRSLVKQTHGEPFLSPTLGQTERLHLELVFDPQMQKRIEGQFHESLIFDRIRWSGVALAGIALFLLGALAVLKLDPLYRRRVWISAGVGVLLVISLGLLIVR